MTALKRAAPRPGAQPLQRHRYTIFSDNHLLSFFCAAFGVVLTVWIRHNGIDNLTDGAVPSATSLTQLTGIAASFAGLAGLALAGRPLAIEHRYGLDRVFIWHRILGETMAVLVGVHVVAGVFAWGLDSGFGAAIIDLTGRDSYMALAFVGRARSSALSRSRRCAASAARCRTKPGTSSTCWRTPGS